MISEETLVEYALGGLATTKRREIEQALVVTPALRRSLGIVQATLDAIQEPVVAGATVDKWSELFATGAHRFMPFADELAEIFDVGFGRMMEVLNQFDDRNEAGRWQFTGVPGVRFVHFEPGARLAGTDSGLVCFAPGASFPAHNHHGRELTYVVQGTLRMSGGQTLGPGDQCLLRGGSHSVSALDEEVLYLTFHEGFTVNPDL